MLRAHDSSAGQAAHLQIRKCSHMLHIMCTLSVSCPCKQNNMSKYRVLGTTGACYEMLYASVLCMHIYQL